MKKSQWVINDNRVFYTRLCDYETAKFYFRYGMFINFVSHI